MTPRSAPEQPNPIGDSSGFQQLYQDRHLAVYRFIFGLNGGPIQEVEDLTTQTFMRAWKSRLRFQGDERAAFAWLLTIARNLVIDHNRHRKRNPTAVDIETQALPTPDLTPEEMATLNEQRLILLDLLNQLPDQPREILTLRYLLDWRVKDIAGHLGLSENHVSVLLRRTIQRLRKQWPNP